MVNFLSSFKHEYRSEKWKVLNHNGFDSLRVLTLQEVLAHEDSPWSEKTICPLVDQAVQISKMRRPIAPGLCGHSRFKATVRCMWLGHRLVVCDAGAVVRRFGQRSKNHLLGQTGILSMLWFFWKTKQANFIRISFHVLFSIFVWVLS